MAKAVLRLQPLGSHHQPPEGLQTSAGQEQHSLDRGVGGVPPVLHDRLLLLALTFKRVVPVWVVAVSTPHCDSSVHTLGRQGCATSPAAGSGVVST